MPIGIHRRGYQIIYAGIAPPPAPTSLAITGASSGIVGTRTPTVTFTAAPGATSHKLQWSTDSGFSTVTGETTITMPTAEYTHTVALTHNTTYYWRVAAVGAGGQGEWSDTVSALVYDYIAYVLSVQPANLIAYWPLNEASGSTADNAEGTMARDGTYVNVTPGTDAFDAITKSPTFDGTGDTVNIYTASLNTAWPALEGTAIVWAKFASGELATAASRWLLQFRGSTVFDQILIFKPSANTIRFEIRGSSGGNTQKFVTNTFNTDLTWAMFAVTWSQAGDAFKAYQNGGQVGTTQTAFNDFVGPLSSFECAIGATTGTTGANSMNGSCAHCAVWNTPLSDAQILALYNAANPT